MTGLSDWVYIAAAALLAAIGGPLLLWALFRDRSRGRARCPRCFYSMAGVEPAPVNGCNAWTCPECGKVARRPRDLHRTRRRRKWAALAALLLIAAIASAKFPAARQRGLISYVPTTALLWARDLAYHYRWGGSEIGAELLHRSHDWRVTSRQLARINPPELASMVTQPMANGFWPRGEPLLVSVELPTWFNRRASLFAELRLRGASRPMIVAVSSERPPPHPLHARLKPFNPSESYPWLLWKAEAGWWDSHLVLDAGVPAQTEADDQVTFDWSLFRQSADERRQTLWTGATQFPLTIVNPDSRFLDLSPVRSAELDGMLRRLIAGFAAGSVVTSALDPRAGDAHLSVEIQLVRQDAVVGLARLVIPAGVAAEAMSVPLLDSAARPVDIHLTEIALADQSGRWRVRIRPYLAGLAYYGLTGPYWDGLVEFAAHELVDRAAP